jgi:hypothetical protein
MICHNNNNNNNNNNDDDGTLLVTTASRTALGPTQPPIQWVPGALLLGVKRPGRGAIPLLPNTPSWHGA